MAVEVIVITAFLMTFGIFLGCIAVALRDGQKQSRDHVRHLRDDFDDIVRRLGMEEGQ